MRGGGLRQVLDRINRIYGRQSGMQNGITQSREGRKVGKEMRDPSMQNYLMRPLQD
jgi:hypothetical protein